jgi:hypothetical protein
MAKTTVSSPPSPVSFPPGEPITAVSSESPPAIEEKDLAASSTQSVFDLAYNHRRMIYQTLKDGVFPLLPDKDGRVDTTRPENIVSGYGYKGPTILILKAHQAAHGFPTPEYAAESQLEEASRRTGVQGTTIRNPHPVTISISDPDTPDSSGKPSVKFIRLYNIAEAAHPDAVRQLAKERAVEREQSFNAWQEKKAGESAAKGESFEIRPFYQPRRRESDYAFEINQQDPEKYLGQVYTAMTLGTRNVKVDQYAAGVVKENLIHYLYDRGVSKTTGKEINNPLKVYSLGNAAGSLCRQNLEKIFTGPGKERETPRQNPTRTHRQEDMAPGY